MTTTASRQRYWFPRPLLATLIAMAAIFATGGHAAQIVLWLYGITAIAIGLVCSSAEGLTMLILVSCVDGISKGVMPGWFTLLLKDLVMWACLLRWFFRRVVSKESSALRTRTAVWVLIFVGWVLVEAANLTTRSPLVALAGVRSWVGWVPVFFVAYDEIKRREDLLALFVTIVIAAGFVGAYGALQQKIGYDHLLRISPNFGYYKRLAITGGVYRSMSTLPHPGIFGCFMGASLALSLALAMARMLPARLRWVCLVSMLFCAAGVVSSGGRLAAATAIMGVLVVLLTTRQARTFFLGAVLLLPIVYGAITMTAPQAATRISRLFNTHTTLWRVYVPFEHGWVTAMRSPMGVGVATGVGIGRASDFMGSGDLAISTVSAGMIENDYGRAFRELGLVGGFLLLALMVHVLIATYRGLLSTASREWLCLAAGLAAVVVSEAAAMLVGQALYLMPVAGMFWIAVAGIQRVGQANQQAEAATEEADGAKKPTMAEWAQSVREAKPGGSGR